MARVEMSVQNSNHAMKHPHSRSVSTPYFDRIDKALECGQRERRQMYSRVIGSVADLVISERKKGRDFLFTTTITSVRELFNMFRPGTSRALVAATVGKELANG